LVLPPQWPSSRSAVAVKSFFGDLHATGRDGVEFYTTKKVITARWF